MTVGADRLKSPLLQALILATLVTVALFFWEGSIGFNLGDEAFFWYGVQRVMLGEVPIRDFMSYDPGRYYWSAALMTLWGKQSIVALRISVAIFQALGLFVGLWLIARSQKKNSFLYVALSAVTLSAWMFVYYKAFDISTTIFLIGILTFLIEKPKKTTYFLAGLCLGIFAFFGRNHGVYGLISSLGVMLWLNFKKETGPSFWTGFSFWASGIILGFMPIFLMMLFIPGFAASFWESIRFLFESKITNLPLPLPWPWKVHFITLFQFLNGFFIGAFFIAILLFGILSICWVFWQKWRLKAVAPALVAAIFIALPYAHYSYSRADMFHLSLGIFPFLIGCLIIFSNLVPYIKWSLAFGLCGISLIATYNEHPGWACRASQFCTSVEVSGDRLRVDNATAENIDFLNQLAKQYAPEGTNFVTIPLPTAYVLLDRKSPLWEIYSIFPRSTLFQEAEIERIKKADPAFILILDIAPDGRDELRFKNTHPLIYQYILNHFELSRDSFVGSWEAYVYIPKQPKNEKS